MNPKMLLRGHNQDQGDRLYKEFPLKVTPCPSSPPTSHLFLWLLQASDVLGLPAKVLGDILWKESQEDPWSLQAQGR